MFFQTPRKAAAVLLVAIALLCAAPSQAVPYHPRRASEEPARVDAGRSFTGFLLHLLELLGGALDPNGLH